MNEVHFVIRTIRGGKIKVYGQDFAPSEQFLVYDGRLDGKRYAFGRYRDRAGYEPFLSMWGTEEQFKAVGEERPPDGPELVVGESTLPYGSYPWVWWYPAKEKP